jgi:rubrerythrin
MNNTTQNLKEAFAGESQASQKYLAFAKKAEKEGFHNVATLFRTAAEAERIHAEGHLGALDGIGSTADNLGAAIAGEIHEYTQMYPPMLQQAETENHKAKRMFAYAVKAEAVHARLYQLALEAVQQGKDLPQDKVFLCPICGDIEFGAPPETCPVCKAKGSSYVQVR